MPVGLSQRFLQVQGEDTRPRGHAATPTDPPAIELLTCHAHASMPRLAAADPTGSVSSPRRCRRVPRSLPCSYHHRISPCTGEEARVDLPRGRRPRRCLLRRLHPVHHQALHGGQADRGRARRRLPAAVAAGVPGLKLHPALCNGRREPAPRHRLDGACHRDARRRPDRTPRRG